MVAAAETRISAARWRLARTPAAGFFADLLLGLPMVEEDSATCPTMQTDGKAIYWSRAFVDRLSDAELAGVLLHEALHPANRHHTRRPAACSLAEWNICADLAINPTVLTVPGVVLPAGALIDAAYSGMSAEQIWRERQRQRRQQPQQAGGQGGQPGGQGGQASASGQPGGQGGQASASGQPGGQGGQAGQPGGQAPGERGERGVDPGGCGGIIEAAPESAAAEDAAWQRRVRQAIASHRARNAGTAPADLERLVPEMAPAAVDWRDVLRRYVDECGSRVASWARPNRRFLASGLVLPGMVPDAMARLVVISDTSGSVDDAAQRQAMAEARDAWEGGAAEALTVVFADVAVQRVQDFSPGDDWQPRPAGGGGTSFRAALDWVRDNRPDAAAIVYLTDLETRDFGSDPGIPVLWGFCGDARRFAGLAAAVPFGETVLVQAD